MRTLGAVATLAALTLSGGAAAQAEPSPAPAPAGDAPAAGAPAPAEPSGAFRIRSAVLGEERSFVVLAPPGYATSGRRYPVVYFTDGSPSLAVLATVTRFLAQNGRMPEVLLVGIDHADRMRDLTPSPGQFEGAPPAVFKTSGGGERFLSFVQDELVPHVERTYRTEPFRMLVGHSLGGLLAVHAQLARPGLFQATLALAPTLTWNGDEPVRRAREALAGSGRPRGVLVIVSPEDGPEAAKQAKALVGAAGAAGGGLQVTALDLPGEDHWSVVLEGASRGFKEVFAGWTMPAAVGAIGPRGGLPAVERHYAKLSERLGWTVHPPEPVVEAAGRQAIRDGKLDDGIRALRQNAAWYPASAEAHDVLGMALARADRLDEAKRSFRTALDLAERAKDPGAAAYRAHLEAATARSPIREFNPTWPGLPNSCGKAGDRSWEDHHHHGN
ncbi:alpha/beta hydrolase-fold protein [Anaeromyxobacter sp. Red801]|uniref:alpha/beta hydrolase-fold protein n=1 Tax=Anaeromyxobacter sp. Red801 TaxID=3411632 RepID=UPI003B9EE728